MRVYDFDDYKDFVRERIQSMPKRGHGQYLKISQFLNIHSTMVSQIFKGSAQMTPEHSLKFCEYLGLNEMETDYFLILVQRERAGTLDLKSIFQNNSPL